jgi:hypothetical protein
LEAAVSILLRQRGSGRENARKGKRWRGFDTESLSLSLSLSIYIFIDIYVCAATKKDREKMEYVKMVEQTMTK